MQTEEWFWQSCTWRCYRFDRFQLKAGVSSPPPHTHTAELQCCPPGAVMGEFTDKDVLHLDQRNMDGWIFYLQCDMLQQCVRQGLSGLSHHLITQSKQKHYKTNKQQTIMSFLLFCRPPNRLPRVLSSPFSGSCRAFTISLLHFAISQQASCPCAALSTIHLSSSHKTFCFP